MWWCSANAYLNSYEDQIICRDNATKSMLSGLMVIPRKGGILSWVWRERKRHNHLWAKKSQRGEAAAAKLHSQYRTVQHKFSALGVIPKIKWQSDMISLKDVSHASLSGRRTSFKYHATAVPSGRELHTSRGVAEVTYSSPASPEKYGSYCRTLHH